MPGAGNLPAIGHPRFHSSLNYESSVTGSVLCASAQIVYRENGGMA